MLLDEQIARNRRRSKFLFFGFFLIYAVLGVAVSAAFAGWPISSNWTIVVIFFLMAGVIIVFTLKMGDDMAVILARASQITERGQCPPLWDAVETMALAAGRPMPRVYLSPDRSANAFAAGRKPEDAVICVNRGLLEILDKNELEAVVAHEMAHVRNLDIRLMTYAAVLAGGIVIISEMLLRMFIFTSSDRNNQAAVIGAVVALLAAILAPIAAAIIQMAVSRQREYLADATAADLTRYPQALASALRQLDSNQRRASTGSKATAHLYFIAPMVGRKPSKLFSTHPPIEERIKRLDEMAGGVTYSRQQSNLGSTVNQEAVIVSMEEEPAGETSAEQAPERPVSKWPIILLGLFAGASAALLFFSF